jgi:hypothetical protein
VIASFQNTAIISQLGEDGTSMTGVETKSCQCLSPSDAAQNDPNALVEIEDEQPDAVSIPAWLQFLEVEAAALLEESE